MLFLLLFSLLLLQSVAEDAMPWLMKTSIPPLWQHPVGPAAYPFAIALTTMFYGPSIGTKFSGLLRVLKAVTGGAGGTSATQQKAKAS
jgi:tetrahydromethanopterin S-methyltransferase subunit B